MVDYTKDYYSILGVDEKATPEALRNSYRRLAKLHHPDKNPGDPGAEERFKIINEAYEVLSNEISRHVYDSYRKERKRKAVNQSSTNEEDGRYTNRSYTKTRTYKVPRFKRIYVHGFIEVKFQGEPEISSAYSQSWEQRFTIIPIEVLATITSSSIYKDGPPKEYQRAYSTSELFKSPLKQPINCRIVSGSQEEYYQLELYEIRVKEPKLKHITKHENYSFGILEGTLFAYILLKYEEEVTEEFSEYYGPTGKVEIKTEGACTFTRQQFYAKDSSTYWTEWKRSQTSGRKYNTTQASVNQTHNGACLTWIVLFLIIAAIWPKLLIGIVPIIAFLLILALIGWLISAFSKVLPWLAGLAILFFIAIGIRSIFIQSGTNKKSPVYSREIDSVKSEKEVVHGQHNESDTLIRHTLVWEDRESSKYTIQLSILSSALNTSANAHRQMDYQQYALQGIGAVYRSMLATDAAYLDPVVIAFDSLAKVKSLSRQQKASMVVSCIQSIPYTQITDGPCSDNNEEFFRQYRIHCESGCCKGYAKFGIQSPAEFIGDLKGDCDTRALLLYDVLGKLGYQVALLTSSYYKHALIAVNLDEIQAEQGVAIYINGKPYYLWETTSKGFGPGNIPASLSNINNWSVTLNQ